MGNFLAKEEENTHLPVWLSKLLLYGSGPFFVNPVKPVLNAIEGADYRRAYTHFRRDHKVPTNILYHCLCLCFQLTANFALLLKVDETLFPGKGWGPIASISTLLWLGTVLFRSGGAPALVKLASVVSVSIGFLLRHSVAANWQILAFAMTVMEVAALQVFVVNKAKDSSGKDRKPFSAVQYAKIMAARLTLHYFAVTSWRGSLAGSKGLVNVLVALFVAKSSQYPYTSGLFFVSFIGGLLALLTDQPALYFYSTGFMATLCQGVAHHYAGEEGTLPQLAKIGDELSHTTFFPNLLFHTVYQSATSGNSPEATFA